MGRLIDADEVVAMLEKEAKEWAVAADVLRSEDAKILHRGIARGYGCAAHDVATMANEQADGNVPADKVE